MYFAIGAGLVLAAIPMLIGRGIGSAIGLRKPKADDPSAFQLFKNEINLGFSNAVGGPILLLMSIVIYPIAFIRLFSTALFGSKLSLQQLQADCTEANVIKWIDQMGDPNDFDPATNKPIIVSAVDKSDKNAIKKLIEAGANVDIYYEDKPWVYHYCNSDNANWITFNKLCGILQDRYDFNEADRLMTLKARDTGDTGLHAAYRKGNFMFAFSFEDAKNKMHEVKNNAGETALDIIDMSNVEILKKVLKALSQASQPKGLSSTLNARIKTALQTADVAFLEMMITEGPKNPPVPPIYGPQIPSHRLPKNALELVCAKDATVEKNANTIKLLLEKANIDSDKIAVEVNTAIKNDNAELMGIFVDTKPEVVKKSNEFTNARYYRKPKVLKLLIEKEILSDENIQIAAKKLISQNDTDEVIKVLVDTKPALIKSIILGYITDTYYSNHFATWLKIAGHLLEGEGTKLLELALEHKYTNYFQSLLENLKYDDNQLSTVINLIAKSGNVEALKALQKAKPDFVKNSDVLKLACEYKQSKLAKTILENKEWILKIDLTDAKILEAIEYLLENDVDLFKELMAKHPGIVDIMLTSIQDDDSSELPALLDKNNISLMQLAVERGHTVLVRSQVEANDSRPAKENILKLITEAIDQQGLPSHSKNIEVLRKYIAEGNSLTVTDDKGDNPLHSICKTPNVEITKLLLNNLNAKDILSTNKDGLTPLKIAREQPQSEARDEVIKLIEARTSNKLGKSDKSDNEKENDAEVQEKGSTAELQN